MECQLASVSFLSALTVQTCFFEEQMTHVWKSARKWSRDSTTKELWDWNLKTEAEVAIDHTAWNHRERPAQKDIFFELCTTFAMRGNHTPTTTKVSLRKKLTINGETCFDEQLQVWLLKFHLRFLKNTFWRMLNFSTCKLVYFSILYQLRKLGARFWILLFTTVNLYTVSLKEAIHWRMWTFRIRLNLLPLY